MERMPAELSNASYSTLSTDAVLNLGYTCIYMNRSDHLTNKSLYGYGNLHIELYAGLAISTLGLITTIVASCSIYSTAK